MRDKGHKRGVSAAQGCSDARRFAKVLARLSIFVSQAVLGRMFLEGD